MADRLVPGDDLTHPERVLFDVTCPQCGVVFYVRRGDAKSFRTTTDVDGVAEVEVTYTRGHRCERIGNRHG